MTSEQEPQADQPSWIKKFLQKYAQPIIHWMEANGERAYQKQMDVTRENLSKKVRSLHPFDAFLAVLAFKEKFLEQREK